METHQGRYIMTNNEIRAKTIQSIIPLFHHTSSPVHCLYTPIYLCIYILWTLVITWQWHVCLPATIHSVANNWKSNKSSRVQDQLIYCVSLTSLLQEYLCLSAIKTQCNQKPYKNESNHTMWVLSMNTLILVMRSLTVIGDAWLNFGHNTVVVWNWKIH